MTTKKVLSFLAVFILGIAIGTSGYWFFTVKQPELKAYKAAVKEQEKLNDMHYAGRVVQVAPKQILLQVARKGGEEVKNAGMMNIEFTNETTIQEGMDFIKEPGEELDLTKYIKPGIVVDVLVDGNQALALHFDSLPLDATMEPEKQ